MMMSKYKVMIHGVRKNELADLMTRLPKHCTFLLVDHESEGEAPRTEVKMDKTGERTILSLTGKKPQKGTKREQMLKMLERLEKSNGIGTVTRRTFRQSIEAKGLETTVISQLVHDGYIAQTRIQK
jgi:hypothetical protein